MWLYIDTLRLLALKNTLQLCNDLSKRSLKHEFSFEMVGTRTMTVSFKYLKEFYEPKNAFCGVILFMNWQKKQHNLFHDFSRMFSTDFMWLLNTLGLKYLREMRMYTGHIFWLCWPSTLVHAEFGTLIRLFFCYNLAHYIIQTELMKTNDSYLFAFIRSVVTQLYELKGFKLINGLGMKVTNFRGKSLLVSFNITSSTIYFVSLHEFGIVIWGFTTTTTKNKVTILREIAPSSLL